MISCPRPSLVRAAAATLCAAGLTSAFVAVPSAVGTPHAPVSAQRALISIPAPTALKGLSVQTLVRGKGIVVLAGTNRGGFRSVDGGKTWKAMSLSGNVSTFAASASAPGVVYAGVGATLWRTVNNGATWRRMPAVRQGTGPVTGRITSLAVSKTTVLLGALDGALLSTNGGSSWTRISLGFGGDQVNDVGIEPRSKRLWLATNNKGVWVSTSGGPGFYAFNDGLPPQGTNRYIATGISFVTTPQEVLMYISVCGVMYGNYSPDIFRYQWSGFGTLFAGRFTSCGTQRAGKITDANLAIGAGRYVGMCVVGGCGVRAVLRSGRVRATSWGAPLRRGGAPRVLVGTATGLTSFVAPV